MSLNVIELIFIEIEIFEKGKLSRRNCVFYIAVQESFMLNTKITGIN